MTDIELEVLFEKTLLEVSKTEYYKETVYCYTFFWEGWLAGVYRKITWRKFITEIK